MKELERAYDLVEILFGRKSGERSEAFKELSTILARNDKNEGDGSFSTTTFIALREALLAYRTSRTKFSKFQVEVDKMRAK